MIFNFMAAFLISFPAYSIYERAYCTQNQMLLASDEAKEYFYLYVCDQSAIPRGFFKSELTSLYNVTVSKPVKREEMIFWAKVLGVDPTLTTEKIIQGVLAEFEKMDQYYDQVMMDKIKNKEVLVRLAELYKTHINKSAPPTRNPPLPMIAEENDIKLKEYRGAVSSRITTLCKKQGGEQKMSLDGENNCVCGKTYFTDFYNWKCENGMIAVTKPAVLPSESISDQMAPVRAKQ